MNVLLSTPQGTLSRAKLGCYRVGYGALANPGDACCWRGTLEIRARMWHNPSMKYLLDPKNPYSSKIGPLTFFAFLTGLAVGKLDSSAGAPYYWIILVMGVSGVFFMFFLLMKRSA